MTVRPDDHLIPTFDLGPLLRGATGAHQRIAEAIRLASENVGFYALVNHGVAWDLVKRAFACAAAFHAMPLDDKLKLAVSRHDLGYMGLGKSVTRTSAINQNTKPNWNEAVFFGRDRQPDDPDVIADKPFCGMNQWPTGLPGFRETVLAYCAALEDLALRMVPLFSTSLGLPADFMDPAFRPPEFALRMSHYPPVEAYGENEFGSAPHTDSSLVTFLPQSPIPGLEIRTRDHRWLAAPMIPGSFLVNSGDMMRRWTNHRYLSTPHRVRNLSGVDRYAIPFFFDTSLDYPIACLPTCQGPDNPPRYPPTTMTAYSAWFSRRNYDHRKQEGVTPGTAPGTLSDTSPGEELPS
ncbi:MAG: isopenicillin N synthase family oxygenase [Alphaproteobacteria bacterium]|nr:isopenicillin N synthase family oxygenase [Alphaproteobacteria bacterium]